ncbi:MAG: archaeosortase/exosortase family protein [Bacteroidales bacterium]|nr:archaeosortase/exosortase family protein [Bacteroidales bacterium]
MNITSIKTESFNALLSKIYPIKNLLIFIVSLFGTHFLWKLIVEGNHQGHEIYILGMDFTSFFHHISLFTAKAAYHIMHLIGMTNTQIHDTYLFYQTPNGGFVNVVWGCTGIKQFLMFIAIMLIAPGHSKKKVWYLPFSLFILWIYNIIRIIVITYNTGLEPSSFDYWHSFFNNPFYVLMFILWLIWEEIINKKKNTV